MRRQVNRRGREKDRERERSQDFKTDFFLGGGDCGNHLVSCCDLKWGDLTDISMRLSLSNRVVSHVDHQFPSRSMSLTAGKEKNPDPSCLLSLFFFSERLECSSETDNRGTTTPRTKIYIYTLSCQ